LSSKPLDAYQAVDYNEPEAEAAEVVEAEEAAVTADEAAEGVCASTMFLDCQLLFLICFL
jgi:hypothetical protein